MWCVLLYTLALDLHDSIEWFGYGSVLESVIYTKLCIFVRTQKTVKRREFINIFGDFYRFFSMKI